MLCPGRPKSVRKLQRTLLSSSLRRARSSVPPRAGSLLRTPHCPSFRIRQCGRWPIEAYAVYSGALAGKRRALLRLAARHGMKSKPRAPAFIQRRSSNRFAAWPQPRADRKSMPYGRSAVSISILANGACGEHRRHDSEGIRLEIDAPGCRSRVRGSTESTFEYAPA
jgi:hypothetical protein